MNKHSSWRLAFARHLNTRLDQYSGVRAVLVGGSVARDYSDVYSDLELILYWDQYPEPDIRHSIISNLEADFRYPKIDHGHESALMINGFPVDLWHRTVASEEAVMNKVLRKYSTDLFANNVLDTIKTSIPLYGKEMVESWKNDVRIYPEELSVRLMEEHLPEFHLRQLYFAVHRENPTAIYAMLSDIQSSLFIVLLALNQSYFPTFKWIYKRLAELPLVPTQIESRLKQMYSEPPLIAAKHLHKVLEETLAMVEENHPQVDTAITRYGLDQKPPKAYDRTTMQR